MRKYFSFLLLLIVVVAVLLGCQKSPSSVDSEMDGVDEYIWPTTGISQMLPRPNSKYGVIEYDSAGSFEMSVYNILAADFAEYIADCREAGFVVDYTQSEDYFDAYNDDGYSLWLSYEVGAKKMTIELWAPDDEEESESEATGSTETTASTTATEATSTTEPINEENVQASNDIRSDFKAAMDSYEDFFESYCKFMKKYQENPSDLGLLMDYAKFMQQYSETMEKMEDVKNDDLSNAELAYYTEVNARITKMLLEVAQ